MNQQDKWRKCFCDVPELVWQEDGSVLHNTPLNTLERLKQFLDFVQIRYCLVRPFLTIPDYPLVEIRDLLPSFESDLYEFTNLPGFSMVAFGRSLKYFNEQFQFELLHSPQEQTDFSVSWSSPLEKQVHSQNLQTIQSRLPRMLQEDFLRNFGKKCIISLKNYPVMLPYLLELDRAHILSLDENLEFYLSGIYASLPSDLNRELKRFGMQIGKFKHNDNALYERNRSFVYQFFMELYGFSIASERRTSAAMFARRLQTTGEKFLVRVLGQTDRTITTLMSQQHHRYPRVEKVAVVHVDSVNKEIDDYLREKGFYLCGNRKAIILRFVYRQHAYDENNIRQDRAISVLRQEIIHPLTGEICYHFNVARDMYSMALKLNDITHGEFIGRIRYKKNEIVENTDTHEKRLKFLYAWLSKNQRRIISYTEEFYIDVHKVLEGYLLDTELKDEFVKYNDIYNEVMASFSFIQQARKVKVLEDVCMREYKGKKIGYNAMLKIFNDILSDLKFEIVNYFPEIVNRILYVSENVLNNSYLVSTYIEAKDGELTNYGVEIRKLYGRLVAQLDEFKAIRKNKTMQVKEI